MEDDREPGEGKMNDTILISQSVAHEKLAALAGRQSLPSTSHRHDGQPQRPVLQTVKTAPSPLGHPYNLPALAAPSTPRTTRRQMLLTDCRRVFDVTYSGHAR